MTLYVVTAAKADIPAGAEIGLSADQAARRKHNLEALKGGVYRALRPLQFKQGERLLLEAPSKALLAAMAVAEEEDEQSAAAADVSEVAEEPEAPPAKKKAGTKRRNR